MGIMHMSVEHVHKRSFFALPVLSVVTEDGVMTQNDSSPVIADLRVRTDPFKRGSVELAVLQKLVMVSFDEIFSAIEKCQKTIKLHSITARPEWKKSRKKTERDIEWLNRKEYNPFLWRAWMLMGRSQFYKGDFDEAASTPLVPDEAHNNTFILKGDGEFTFENQGEVKLINMAENAVVYVQVKNWKSSPIVEKQPLATAWAKTSWDGGSWTWREMTAKGNGVFEITGVWGGDGFNISATEAGAESWYPTDHVNFDIQEGAKAGDEIKLTFTSEYGTVGKLKLEVVNAGELTYKDITISAVVPAGWTKCYLYTWNAEGNQTGDWPGEELTITAGKVEKAFSHVAVPLNFIFNNGEGAQTTDQSAQDNVADFDIETNIKTN